MKNCFKCGVKKPLSEFYKHNQMGDGHLGKCKECTKNDVKKRYYDPESRKRIKEYERNRFKDPIRKKNILQYAKNARKRNPLKIRARNIIDKMIVSGVLKRLPCEICGDKNSQAHHYDYSKPLDVTWLCFKHHREAHGQIID